MKTLEQEMSKLEQDFRDKNKELIKKHKVLAQLRSTINIEEYHPPFIHNVNLWNQIGSVHFGGCEYESIREGKNPDKMLLSCLLAGFKPLPLIKVSGGCTSFRHEDEAKKFDEKYIYKCGPVHIRISCSSRWIAQFKWLSKIGGDIWSFEIDYPLYSLNIGTLRTRPKYYGNSGKIASWEICEFSPLPELNAQVIKWASGSTEYPNSFTLYWDRDTALGMNYADLVKG